MSRMAGNSLEMASSSLALADEFQVVYILVMGLTGAGKSTFISRVTGDESIPVGSGLRSVTKEVAEYVLYHKGYEIHLIDSPGFDDGSMTDHKVLQKVSSWINNISKQNWKIGGIIYLHDITKTRMGSLGELNIRVLEKMTGEDNWNNISLVTTKWNCSADAAGEAAREADLEAYDEFWKAMREGQHQATMSRFDGTREGGLKIVEQHISGGFQPAISYQMVDSEGPKLSLGETDAGEVIARILGKRFRDEGRNKDLDEMNDLFRQKFDDASFTAQINGLWADLEKLRRKQLLQKIGRWAIRLTVIGGGLAATLLLENPAAYRAAFAAVGPMELALRRQEQMSKAQIEAMKEGFASSMMEKMTGPRVVEVEERD